MHHKKFKEDESNIVFGTRAVIEAIKSDKEVDKILLQTGLQNELIRELRNVMQEKNIPFQYVPPEKLNRLTRKNHQGVIAYVSEVVYHDLTTILPGIFEQGKVPLILILDRITDVRNFGAIARSAECAGVNAIVIPIRGSSQINADAMKTSAGALHTIPVCREENLKATIEYLKESGISIAACTEKGSNNHYDCKFDQPLAIIMGSEENGVSEEYLKRADIKVKIPMYGTIESLNVSVATGIILFEVLRQRNSQS